MKTTSPITRDQLTAFRIDIMDVCKRHNIGLAKGQDSATAFLISEAIEERPTTYDPERGAKRPTTPEDVCAYIAYPSVWDSEDNEEYSPEDYDQDE